MGGQGAGTGKVGGQTSRKKEQGREQGRDGETEKQEREAATAGQGGFSAS